MQPPRYYGALRETERETQEAAAEVRAARQSAPAPSLTPDAKFLAWYEREERRVAYTDALQEQVDRGRMDRGEKTSRLSRFDRGDPDILREAAGLRDARELLAAARVHEANEQAKVRELEGREG